MEAISVLLDQIQNKELTVDNEGKIFRKDGSEVHKRCNSLYKVITAKISNDERVPVYQHRLLFAYYHGFENLDPELTINHIDFDRHNNAKDNLEQISKAENTSHKHLNPNVPTRIKEDNDKLNSRLKIRLAMLNLKQKDVARKVGVSGHMFSSWARGHSNPPLLKAFRLADILGCSIEELWDYIKEEKQ